MPVQEQRRAVPIQNAGNHVGAVTLGLLKLGLQTVIAQPGSDGTLDCTLFSGITSDRDEPCGERSGLFERCGCRKPSFYVTAQLSHAYVPDIFYKTAPGGGENDRSAVKR